MSTSSFGSKFRFWLVVLAAAAWAGSMDARASDAPPEAESAALDAFAEGQILEDLGDVKGALKAYEAAAKVLDDSPTLFLRLARMSFYVPDYKKARLYASRAVELDPENAEAHFLGGSALYRLGESDEAIAWMSAALEHDRSNVRYAETLASVLEAEGMVENAIDVLEEIKLTNPYELSVLTKLGGYYIARGDAEAAIANLEAAAEADPGFPGVMTRLGAAYDMAGRLDEAIESYRAAIERSPNDFATRKQLIDALFVSGRSDEALREARTLRYMIPDDPDVTRRLAAIAYGAGEFEESLAALDRLGDLEAMTTELYTMRAEIQLRLGDADAAAGSARRALELEARNVRARVMLARAHMLDGQWDDAESQLVEALTQDPDARDARFALALLLNGRQRYEESLAHLDLLSEQSPTDTSVAFQRGVALERMGRFEDAVEVFEAVIAERPRFGEALNYLGYMYADRGENLEEALSLIERAVELQPDNPAFLDSLGWVLFRLGRLDEGREQLVRAASLSEDPVIREHLGDCLLAMGDARDAIRQYEAALSAGAEPDAIEEKLRQARDRSEPD